MTKEDYNIDRGLQKKLSSRNDLTPMLCATSEEEEVVVTDLVHCMCVLLSTSILILLTFNNNLCR